MRTAQPGLGQMSPNGPRPTPVTRRGGGEFEGGRVPSYHGIAGETTEFDDDFRDGRWSMKWPNSGEKYPTSLV
eukprot:scaffold19448_cov53-Cyclotella_meneghiniana.AAC.4